MFLYVYAWCDAFHPKVLTLNFAVESSRFQVIGEVFGEHAQHESMSRNDLVVAGDYVHIKLGAFAVHLSESLVTFVACLTKRELDRMHVVHYAGQREPNTT